MSPTNTEALICRTFLEMIREHPCQSIKVTELTKRAGISRSLFYIYFDSTWSVIEKIEDVFFEGFPSEERALTETISAMNNSKFTKGQGFEDSYEFLFEHMDIYRALSGPNGTASFMVRFRNRHSRIYSQILAKNFPDLPEGERNLLSTFMAGGKVACFDWWAHHPNALTLETYTEFTSELYFQVWKRIMSWMRTEQRKTDFCIPKPES